MSKSREHDCFGVRLHEHSAPQTSLSCSLSLALRMNMFQAKTQTWTRLWPTTVMLRRCVWTSGTRNPQFALERRPTEETFLRFAQFCKDLGEKKKSSLGSEKQQLGNKGNNWTRKNVNLARQLPLLLQ